MEQDKISKKRTALKERIVREKGWYVPSIHEPTRRAEM